MELTDRLQTEYRSTVEEKDRTIQELAGRCGYYQAENEQVRTTLQALQAPLLTAPIGELVVGFFSIITRQGWLANPPTASV
jgi:hypothetical protein